MAFRIPHSAFRIAFARLRDKLRHPWFIALLFITAIPFFPEYAVPFLAAGGVISAYYDAKSRHRAFAIGPLGKILLVFIAYQIIELTYTRTLADSVANILMWIVCFLVYLTAVTVLTNRKRLETAFFCVSLVAGVVGLIGCVMYGSYMLGGPPWMQFWAWLDGPFYRLVSFFGVDIAVTGVRASSTFTNPNILGEYAVMAAPFLTYYAFSGNRAKGRILCRFCLIFLVGAVAFSFSRGGYLGLLLMALVFAFANIRKILAMILSLCAVVVLIPPTVLQRFMTVGGLDFATVERMNVWYTCLGAISKNPIFGTGPGVDYIWKVLNNAGINAPHAHNLILELLVEGGIVGLGIMAYLGYRALRNSVELISGRDTRREGVPFVAFAAAFFASAMVEYSFLSPKLLAFFMLAMALLDVTCRLRLPHREVTWSAANAARKLKQRRAAVRLLHKKM